MLKLLLLVAGVAAGAGGAVSWLLSEPGPRPAPSTPPTGESLQARVQDLKLRFHRALEEGKRAGGETEARLERQALAYRKNPDNPPTS